MTQFSIKMAVEEIVQEFRNYRNEKEKTITPDRKH